MPNKKLEAYRIPRVKGVDKRIKLTPDQRTSIRDNPLGLSQRALAGQYGISRRRQQTTIKRSPATMLMQGNTTAEKSVRNMQPETLYRIMAILTLENEARDLIIKIKQREIDFIFIQSVLTFFSIMI